MDENRPDAGRIFNYISGGDYHTEIDRNLADQIITLEPTAQLISQMQRRALLKTVRELTENNQYDVIIDFGTGVPDHGYIHDVVPSTTTVIYSDKDVDVVKHCRLLLRDVPNAHYFHSAAEEPEDLLNQSAVLDLLDGRRYVAIMYWALSSFLSNDHLAHIAQYLYDWSDAHSCLLFNLQTHNSQRNDPKISEIIRLFKQMDVKRYRHSIDECIQLIKPWRANGKGFISLFEWNEIDPDPECGTSGYGAHFVKGSKDYE